MPIKVSKINNAIDPINLILDILEPSCIRVYHIERKSSGFVIWQYPLGRLIPEFYISVLDKYLVTCYIYYRTLVIGYPGKRKLIMLLSINDQDPRPVYVQIVNQIKEQIQRGILKPGDELPSVRELSESLGINLHTVRRAYVVLRDQKLLVFRLGQQAKVA